MKIALLTKYGDLAASTRQRFKQFRPHLQDVGFEIEHLPLLDDDYLRELYASGRRNRVYLAARYFQRIRWLIRRQDVSVIWLHCELFPYLPGLFEMLARWPGKPVVFDFDDAIFHNYDLHPNPFIRRILAHKLRTTIRGSELALCGNAYLADYARPFCNRVEIVPTVLDTQIYGFRPAGRRPVNTSFEVRHDFATHIGWIGTPSTWTQYMLPMMPLLSDVAAQNRARIVTVGAGSTAALDPFFDHLAWTEDTEVARIQDADIGIMPLTETPWARGKCGYKLIQYMACGIPVVASPVGVNADIVEHGVNGFLASTEAEWRTALTMLARDPALRRRMGIEGRRKVEQHYSLQVWGPHVAALLREVAARGRVS